MQEKEGYSDKDNKDEREREIEEAVFESWQE